MKVETDGSPEVAVWLHLERRLSYLFIYLSLFIYFHPCICSPWGGSALTRYCWLIKFLIVPQFLPKKCRLRSILRLSNGNFVHYPGMAEGEPGKHLLTISWFYSFPMAGRGGFIYLRLKEQFPSRPVSDPEFQLREDFRKKTCGIIF